MMADTAACVLVLSVTPAQAAVQPCAAGYVRLTFDDGPHRRAAPAILDTLEARGARATFFVVGSLAAARPGIVRRASTAGHGIGSHSWNHPDLTTLSREQVTWHLARTNTVIRQATGVSPTEWRPPYGASNVLVEAAARDVCLTSMVLWTVDPRDWADPPATTVPGPGAAGRAAEQHRASPRRHGGEYPRSSAHDPGWARRPGFLHEVICRRPGQEPSGRTTESRTPSASR
jgi:peptidoglycan/xylan/chitin deacetylase (PgdA/CDA1 family)